MLIVEQNANAALELSHRAYLLEVGQVVLGGASASCASTKASEELPGLLMARVHLQQVGVGRAGRGARNGAIYASLALALVLIYRATHVINFAQGEMGMFSTYIAWALITHHGWSYWPAFVFTLGSRSSAASPSTRP